MDMEELIYLETIKELADRETKELIAEIINEIKEHC